MGKKITIDKVEYDLDNLTDPVKAHLFQLQSIDVELTRFNAQIAIHQTARGAYSEALNAELAKMNGDSAKKKK